MKKSRFKQFVKHIDWGVTVKYQLKGGQNGYLRLVGTVWKKDLAQQQLDALPLYLFL